MADFLESVGRSRIGSDLSDYVLSRRKLALSEEENKIAAARSSALNEMTGEQISLKRNQRMSLEQEQAELNRKVPIQPLKDMFVVPEAGDFAFNVAKAHGFIDADGTISIRNRNKMMEFLNMPMFAQRLSGMRIKHWRDQYNHFKKVLSDKEYAKESGVKPEEAQEGMMNALSQWNAAVGADSGLMKKIEQESKLAIAENKADLEERKLAEKTREVDIKEGELELKKKNPFGSKASDFMRAYLQKKSQPGMEELSMDQFKRLFWTKPTSETGKLGEQGVLEDIRELVNYDPKKAIIWTKKYYEYRKQKLSREDALQKVKEQFESLPTGKDYSHLWR